MVFSGRNSKLTVENYSAIFAYMNISKDMAKIIIIIRAEVAG